MGGIKTCKKIMNNEFEYVPPQKNRWPTSEKEIIRNQNTKVELTRYKRVKKYDDFVFKTSGYEVDHVCAGKCWNFSAKKVRKFLNRIGWFRKSFNCSKAVKSNVLDYLTELESGSEKANSQFDRLYQEIETNESVDAEEQERLEKVQAQLRLIE